MTDQASRLRQQIKFGDERPNGKTISVVSGKGGVGKSTFVVNFAIELQKSGQKVLIFDLDIGMGNVDILLGQQSTYTIANFFESFLPIHDMIEIGPKGISYIAGGTGFNQLLELDETKLQYFFTQYELLIEQYDYIFFDLGAGMSKVSLAFILSSDECFLITTPEPTSIADAYSAMKHIVSENKRLPIYTLMNRSKTIRQGNRMLDKFADVSRNFLNKEIIQLGSLPFDDTVLQAVQRQIPYVILKENASVSKAIKAIVMQYLRLQNGMIPSKKTTFIDRLRKLLLVR